ncbi:DNA glycosylase AlkZ-like family protein [Deinococcus ruber]|uniref:DNA glycosylase AlkZ-like family protein n=1 Tax=Deinococcus ruber TaxID=1848197 RepID=UPI001E48B684|nr:crosslink repair DNA glycosylase YcaQ family protein [Deinococcus ruber]
MSVPTAADLRSYALSHTLFARTDLQTAISRLGFVQADPIRAPARAQDLILMQRVRGYRAGDLERHYPALDVEEDYFPNYGFMSRPVWSLLHPRSPRTPRIELDAPGLMERVLAHVQQAGELHPRSAGEVFGRTRVENNWGGSSNAATRALEALHYAGSLRIVRRESGVKVFGPAQPSAQTLSQQERLRAVVMVLARLYAPASEAGLRLLVGLSHYGLPGLLADLRRELTAAVNDGELLRVQVDGVPYLLPADEMPEADLPAGVRLVAPFDPLVWDRRRFEHLHGWAYRFEAYTPPAKRVLGYYALPLFWQGRAVGWANLSVKGGDLLADIGWQPGVRQTAALRRALDAELSRYRTFLGLDP